MEICVQNTVDSLITSKNGYPADQLHSRDNATNALDTRIRVSWVLNVFARTSYTVIKFSFYRMINANEIQKLRFFRINSEFRAHNHQYRYYH